ncbi:MAG TPA: aminoglycoside phosphotransferase [Actinomycetes bacterium]
MSADLRHGPTHEELAEFLGRQRWFAGQHGSIAVTDVRTLARLVDDPPVDVLMIDAEVDGGETVTYQLELERTAAPVERLEHVRVGAEPAYDALHDREVTPVWPRLIAEEATVGSLSFHRVHHDGGPELLLDRPSLVFTGEQSNTTLAYGDAMVLKVYRQVAAGVNPDVEVHVALDRVGCPHIAAPLGWVDSPEGVLAFLQEFLVGATEGWESAKASVRDLFVEADLHPSDCGGDFAAEAERLGIVTAEVHAALRVAFPTDVLDPSQLAERAQLMRDRLDAAVEEAPSLRPYAKGLARAFDDLHDAALAGEKLAVQRVHGDFHLGQVLRTSAGWKLLDFEGEPATPADERRALDTPMRDVAAMLRSLDYAARMVLLDHPDDSQRAYRAAEWVEHNADAFCSGYAAAAGRHPRDDDVLLRALVTEKAVYEVIYESRMRPGWTVLPMAAIERLAG